MNYPNFFKPLAAAVREYNSNYTREDLRAVCKAFLVGRQYAIGSDNIITNASIEVMASKLWRYMQEEQ